MRQNCDILKINFNIFLDDTNYNTLTRLVAHTYFYIIFQNLSKLILKI